MNSGKKSLIFSVLFTAVLCAGLYLYKPVSFRDLSTVEGFVRYTRSFGSIMPLAVFAATVLQAIVPVIPFIILCSAGGLLFGLVNGIIITWVGTLTGASLAFFVSRQLGYDWAARKYSKSRLKQIDRMNGRQGFFIILALRLLPYFPAPLINISAGVSRIRYSWFLLASALGKLPFIIGYTLLGYSLLHSRNYTSVVSAALVLLIVPYLIVKLRATRALLQEKGR